MADKVDGELRDANLGTLEILRQREKEIKKLNLKLKQQEGFITNHIINSAPDCVEIHNEERKVIDHLKKELADARRRLGVVTSAADLATRSIGDLKDELADMKRRRDMEIEEKVMERLGARDKEWEAKMEDQRLRFIKEKKEYAEHHDSQYTVNEKLTVEIKRLEEMLDKQTEAVDELKMQHKEELEQQQQRYLEQIKDLESQQSKLLVQAGLMERKASRVDLVSSDLMDSERIIASMKGEQARLIERLSETNKRSSALEVENSQLAEELRKTAADLKRTQRELQEEIDRLPDVPLERVVEKEVVVVRPRTPVPTAEAGTQKSMPANSRPATREASCYTGPQADGMLGTSVLRELRSKNALLEKQIKEAFTENAKWKQGAESAERRLKELQQSRTREEVAFNDVKAELNTLQSEMKRLEEQNRTFIKENVKLRRECQRLQELEESRAESSDSHFVQHVMMKREIATLRSTVSNYRQGVGDRGAPEKGGRRRQSDVGSSGRGTERMGLRGTVAARGGDAGSRTHGSDAGGGAWRSRRRRRRSTPTLGMTPEEHQESFPFLLPPINKR